MCDPDFNVWTESVNVPPENTTSLRSAGGHIHVGYDNPTMERSSKIIMAMDIFLGIPSIILDKDKDRRKMYGKAGCFRFKDFGCEYRTLSNFWIFDDELIEWVFNNTQKAIEFVNNDTIITNDKEIINCINNQDITLAYQLINSLNISLPKSQLLTV